MLDRSNCKEMWVWCNNILSNPKKVIRIVLEIFEDRSCLVVMGGDEEHFYKEEAFDTNIYDHCAEIKEPIKRLMTRNELLGFITHNPHIVVRERSQDKALFLPQYPDILKCDKCEYASIDEKGNIGDWHKFEVKA